MSATRIAELLVGPGSLLLDFDGPVCGVFAGRPAPVVAANLAAVLSAHGVQVPAELVGGGDPMVLLRWTADLGRPDLTRAVEDTLIAEERTAVAVASETPGARDLIAAAHQAGRAVAVVSNNSAEAIADYLNATGLRDQIAVIVGRPYADPAAMKPAPDSLHKALTALGSEAESAVMVGDSVADMAAAVAAGVAAIGYANRPGKRETLAAAGADLIVTDMRDLAASYTRV